MLDAAEKLEFERAALLRDELYELKTSLEPQKPAKREKVFYTGRTRSFYMNSKSPHQH